MVEEGNSFDSLSTVMYAFSLKVFGDLLGLADVVDVVAFELKRASDEICDIAVGRQVDIAVYHAACHIVYVGIVGYENGVKILLNHGAAYLGNAKVDFVNRGQCM